jgi:hypothetical protein
MRHGSARGSPAEAAVTPTTTSCDRTPPPGRGLAAARSPRYDAAVQERAACALLKRRFEAAGFTIAENRTFDEDGVRFELDGFDAAHRVGYEYVTSEAGDSWDVDGEVVAALAARHQRGDLYILVIDEVVAPDAASINQLTDEFLADLRDRGVPPRPTPAPPADEPPADRPPADEPPAARPTADVDEPPAARPMTARPTAAADEPPADGPSAARPTAAADEPPADETPADEPAADELVDDELLDDEPSDGPPTDEPLVDEPSAELPKAAKAAKAAKGTPPPTPKARPAAKAKPTTTPRPPPTPKGKPAAKGKAAKKKPPRK